jgi:hypothetical protein
LSRRRHPLLELDPRVDARGVVGRHVHLVDEVFRFLDPVVDGDELARAVDLDGGVDPGAGDVKVRGRLLRAWDGGHGVAASDEVVGDE